MRSKDLAASRVAYSNLRGKAVGSLRLASRFKLRKNTVSRDPRRLRTSLSVGRRTFLVARTQSPTTKRKVVLGKGLLTGG